MKAAEVKTIVSRLSTVLDTRADCCRSHPWAVTVRDIRNALDRHRQKLEAAEEEGEIKCGRCGMQPSVKLDFYRDDNGIPFCPECFLEQPPTTEAPSDEARLEALERQGERLMLGWGTANGERKQHATSIAEHKQQLDLLPDKFQGIKDRIRKLEDKLDSTIETIEILGDSEAMESLRRGEEDIKAERLTDHDDVVAELTDPGCVSELETALQDLYCLAAQWSPQPEGDEWAAALAHAGEILKKREARPDPPKLETADDAETLRALRHLCDARARQPETPLQATARLQAETILRRRNVR